MGVNLVAEFFLGGGYISDTEILASPSHSCVTAPLVS